MRGVDDVDFPELVGHLVARLAQEVDDLADGPVFGHRDEVALHQAARRFLRIGKRFLDGGTLVCGERAQHFGLVGLVHVLENGDGIVRLHVRDDIGDLARLQLVDQRLADDLVHFRDDVGVEHVAERGGKRLALLGLDLFDEVGDVGRMQRLGQFLHARGIACGERLGHLFDEGAGQLVVFQRFGRFVVVVGRVGHVAAYSAGGSGCRARRILRSPS